MDRKKELKLAYKETPPPMGVYQIKNTVNGKILVGSGMNLPGKHNSCLFQLKINRHPNTELQADWNTAGPTAFTFEILETLKYQELPESQWRKAIAELEDKWLAKLSPYGDKGYNKLKLKN
ncbi:nuclease [Sporomusaceae bacterium FL31]|nr:nuclease [Sporomusaceae bacterium FL31]GCE34406.1 nuclease [Sporomusaceae bacterium]